MEEKTITLEEYCNKEKETLFDKYGLYLWLLYPLIILAMGIYFK